MAKETVSVRVRLARFEDLSPALLPPPLAVSLALPPPDSTPLSLLLPLPATGALCT